MRSGAAQACLSGSPRILSDGATLRRASLTGTRRALTEISSASALRLSGGSLGTRGFRDGLARKGGSGCSKVPSIVCCFDALARPGRRALFCTASLNAPSTARAGLPSRPVALSATANTAIDMPMTSCRSIVSKVRSVAARCRSASDGTEHFGPKSWHPRAHKVGRCAPDASKRLALVPFLELCSPREPPTRVPHALRR